MTSCCQVLKQHRTQQDENGRYGGVPGRRPAGSPPGRTEGCSTPANAGRRFVDLVRGDRPPPIRLHNLRHGAATPAGAAGADLKDIQEMLGHSSITITFGHVHEPAPPKRTARSTPEPAIAREEAEALRAPGRRRRRLSPGWRRTPPPGRCSWRTWNRDRDEGVADDRGPRPEMMCPVSGARGDSTLIPAGSGPPDGCPGGAS
ncbi:tyrosine-type recombinase/integrase [Streptomyces sp. NPDC048496]|uniref:tyrosine-type recombinase/integrase n=1 Tax=Streptomyces sp. NPDC048496 TaxID=3365558 RepID=UPI0037116DBC